ncbi:hypothetical protein DES52_11474 [Deinococcus yavapaiensis KR-236]|uniref:Uncharacterized protein n=1 Tax=Deinococcus yavapaiensis KR-236 TaxID=694435 RepID=A0A318SIX7_9DEIO|nr:hypothetical protein DES52_11474 [Deinococcus yavapaiensis KR-236]
MPGVRVGASPGNPGVSGFEGGSIAGMGASSIDGVRSGKVGVDGGS